MVRTTICIPENLFAEIKKEAQKCKMSVSKFIVSSLEEFLINQRKKRAAEEVLKLTRENPLSSEASENAFKELKKIKGEWKL